ncbi:Uncharacterised protein [Mycobacteroides abscessus subsp. abscessus]|nr:Uncharacterised protein [Mycobacteroides abscessus subsp. abscessus]
MWPSGEVQQSGESGIGGVRSGHQIAETRCETHELDDPFSTPMRRDHRVDTHVECTGDVVEVVAVVVNRYLDG